MPQHPDSDTLARAATVGSPDGDGGHAVSLAPALVDIDGAARYETVRMLGVGGMGEVRLCRDLRIGREVALKSMRSPQDVDAAVRIRFEREARVQALLEHPAIVPVYEIARPAGGETYFTMKRVRGVTLDAVIAGLRRGDGTLTRPKLLRALSSVCLATAFAHARGVVHRDLKPANVMLGEFGEVNVLDWGIARVVSEAADLPLDGAADLESGTAAGTVLGTPGYMSPEQGLDASAADARSDVYALGCILFELLALEPMHRPGSTMLWAMAEPELAAMPRAPSARAPEREIPPELDEICVRATAPRPEERFASARELADAIDRYLDGERDLALRKQLAGSHAMAATRAIATASSTADPDAAFDARARGLREASVALGLDPAHRGALSALGQLLLTTPDRLPADGERALREESDRKLRAGTRGIGFAVLSWLLWAPLFFTMGVRDASMAGLLTAMVVLFASVNWWLGTRREPAIWQFLVVLAVGGVAFTMVRELFGSFLLFPGILATSTFVWVLNAASRPTWQLVAVAAATVGLGVIWALEGTGVLSPSTQVAGGVITVEPRMIELRTVETSFALWTTNVAMLVVPAFLAIRATAALSRAERRLFAQAWLLRKLAR